MDAQINQEMHTYLSIATKGSQTQSCVPRNSFTDLFCSAQAKKAGQWIFFWCKKTKRETNQEGGKNLSLPLPLHIPSWFWWDCWEIDVSVFFIPSVTAQRGSVLLETSHIPKWWMYTSASAGTQNESNISWEKRLILKIIWNFACFDIENLHSNCHEWIECSVLINPLCRRGNYLNEAPQICLWLLRVRLVCVPGSHSRTRLVLLLIAYLLKQKALFAVLTHSLNEIPESLHPRIATHQPVIRGTFFKFSFWEKRDRILV